jgi:hypothetical protein
LIAPVIPRHELLDRLEALHDDQDWERTHAVVDRLLLSYMGDPGISTAVEKLGLPKGEDPDAEWMKAIERIATM